MCIADREKVRGSQNSFAPQAQQHREHIEALSYLAQSVWMIDGTAFDHVDNTISAPNAAPMNRKYGRPGGCRSQICA